MSQSLDHINEFSVIHCEEVKRTNRPRTAQSVPNIVHEEKAEIKPAKKVESKPANKKEAKKETPPLSFFGKKTTGMSC